MTCNKNLDLAAASRFGQRVRRRYAAELAWLPPGVPTAHTMRALFNTMVAQDIDVAAGLRTLRQLVLERLPQLDCNEEASLDTVTGVMTDLAELALDIACTQSSVALERAHGKPCTAQGAPAQLCVVGMGKLGGRELNISSDIDIIYVYDEEGQTAGDAMGQGRISNQEYFGKQVRAIHALVGDTTEHGFVFRIDLALRPNGNSGPPVVSMAALEEYFYTQGREWERFAWLKSRVVAPAHAQQCAFALGLSKAVTPFVFRRYLDYNVFDALRILHRQIREHAARRSAGHPERSNDVKLSRGGIRELEFTVQLLQVVRGGQYPELRTRSTLSALPRLAAAGLMPANTAKALEEAYILLRRVEHRIQYLDDQQTHILPSAGADLQWIAASMGFPDSDAFLRELHAQRELVAQEFDALLGGEKNQHSGRAELSTTEDAKDFDTLLARLHGRLLERVRVWKDNPRVLALREVARARLVRLLMRTAQWVEQAIVSEESALRLMDWMEPLLRRESYLALLLERPSVHERLLRMLGAARWPARYLLKHPGVIDELANNVVLQGRFDPENFDQDLERRRIALQDAGQDDDEAVLNLLRRAHHTEVFRTLTRDVEGRLSVEQVADDLSALADAVLRITTRWCWRHLKNKHREGEPLFAVIAYGKLGGKELGYGSDLDLVFVYDDAHERAAEVYGALVRKLINWLTVKTSEGDLYEIDTALRPNGNSGMLVTSFDAYANYQQQRGSNTAWTWEHQAMTRARCVLGTPDLQARFEQVRQAVIATVRDRESLRAEISAMRDKMCASHSVKPGQFDLKYSAGGMVDIEFAVQFLVLASGHAHPELRANVGNIALLQRAAACALLPAALGEQAARAYRVLRQIQHRARLNEESPQVPLESVQDERAAAQALWAAIFGAAQHA